MSSSIVSTTPRPIRAGESGPPRRVIAAILLVAGAASLATSFGALPVPLLVALVAAWSSAVAYFGSPIRGVVGMTVLSVCVKLATILVIALLIVDPSSPIGAENPLYWIPLGLANMGSGLWFLKLIRKQA